MGERGKAKSRGMLAEAGGGIWRDVVVEWEVSTRLVGYEEAMRRMDEIAGRIAAKAVPERVWLLQHPALITAGTSARPEELLDSRALPVFNSGRGGRYTYHGPGQRIAYLMLDLRQRGRDVRRFVATLERWIIDALADFGVHAGRDEKHVGVWVNTARGKAKIAAIGVRVSRGVTRHGVALNVDPDLSHFSAIVPCGVREHGVTSLRALGVNASMQEVDAALKRHFSRLFGPVQALGEE